MPTIRRVALAISLLVAGLPVFALPQSAECHEKAPTEVVDSLWQSGAVGELLTNEGWERAAKEFFVGPSLAPGNKTVLIVSNYWGPPVEQIVGDSATVEVGYVVAGRVDSMLRYTGPTASKAMKTVMRYRLVSAPEYSVMYASDGKTILSRKPTGCRIWQIEGSLGAPWATVNAAIRFVLEVRGSTSDLSIKKNADETLAKLLKLH